MINRIKKKLQQLYRKIIYSLFTKLYGKIKGVYDDSEKNRLKVHKINMDQNTNYRIFEINKSVLYTDRIHDTAIIIDQFVVDGASFQLRNNKNDTCDKNIVFKKGTPRIKKKLNGSVMSLLTGGGGNSNYWHWLFDVMPRIGIVEKKIKLENIDYFLLPSLSEKFQKETLDFLQIPNEKRISSKDFRHIEAKKIIVTDHPYNLLNDPSKDSVNIPKWLILFLKDKFRLNDNERKNKYPKKFFIDRSDSKSNIKNLRKITNELEVKNELKKRGYESLRLSDFHFTDQIKLFNNAENIIGLHGAGFANLIFCKSKTKIIEFQVNTPLQMYKNLSLKCDLNYDSINVQSKTTHENKQLGEFEIPIEELKDKIPY